MGALVGALVGTPVGCGSGSPFAANSNSMFSAAMELVISASKAAMSSADLSTSRTGTAVGRWIWAVSCIVLIDPVTTAQVLFKLEVTLN